MLAVHVPPAMKEIWDEAPAKRSAAEWTLRWVWNQVETVSLTNARASI